MHSTASASPRASGRRWSALLQRVPRELQVSSSERPACRAATSHTGRFRVVWSGERSRLRDCGDPVNRIGGIQVPLTLGLLALLSCAHVSDSELAEFSYREADNHGPTDGAGSRILEAEDSDRNASLAIAGLALLEGPIPDHVALLSTLSACPRFTQRLRRHHLHLSADEWVDDDDFDLAHHVHRISVPAPGEQQELFGLLAEVMSWRLDRSRPLWEIWVIEGLSDNRWALLMKLHHSISDGIATVHMLTGLSDGIDDSFTSQVGAESSEPQFAGSTVAPLNWLNGTWRAPVAFSTTAMRAARGAAELAIGFLRPTPSSLSGPITNLRRYSAARISLREVRRVCDAFDVTINDVALAALTESYRNALIRRGEQPLPDSVRTLVPISLRSEDALGETDNRVSLMLPYLPVEEQNPVRRLRLVHSRLARAKSTGQREAGSAVVALANHTPFALTAWAVQLFTRLPQHGVVTVATNVPGPRQPLHIMGCKVTSVLPVPPMRCSCGPV